MIFTFSNPEPGHQNGFPEPHSEAASKTYRRMLPGRSWNPRVGTLHVPLMGTKSDPEGHQQKICWRLWRNFGDDASEKQVR